MSKICKIGDLIIHRDFDDYIGSKKYKSPTNPCVGLVTEISCSSIYIQWIDDHLCTWEKQDSVIVLSRAVFIKSVKT